MFGHEVMETGFLEIFKISITRYDSQIRRGCGSRVVRVGHEKMWLMVRAESDVQ